VRCRVCVCQPDQFMSNCAGMSWGVVLFTTFGGLRGAVSLILAQILVLDQEEKVLSNRRITAEVRLWMSAQ